MNNLIISPIKWKNIQIIKSRGVLNKNAYSTIWNSFPEIHWNKNFYENIKVENLAVRK